MYYHDGQIHIEDEDQCSSCEYFLKGVMCPLLEALGVGVAHLDGDVLVKNCGFYVKFKRHLQVVDGGEPENKPDNDTPSEPPRKRFKGSDKI
jgi:hypothetical protein